MSCFNYSKNKAVCGDIVTHMRQCSGLFNPPLASYVNIYDYAKKIRSNAVTIEAWMNDELIGMVACYLNDFDTFNGYITNISVIQEHQGKGIASILINKTIESALMYNFKTLSLEVEVENKRAIDLYRNVGFVLNGRRGNKYLMINRLLESKDVLVSICCVTYNHAKYIRDAIEGFLIQKVNFPIEILIHDDASIDGTSEIIREYEKNYPEIIKPIYQTENQYSQGRTISPVYQFPRARGKYIAMCEGDDYWTDPHKLQKQVDFLNANPDFSLVHTNCEYLKGKRMMPIQNAEKVKTGFIFESLLKQEFFISTLTVCVRKESIMDWLQICEKEASASNWRMGDYPLWLEGSLHTKFAYMPDITAHYRYVPNSISHPTEIKKRYLFFQSVFEIKQYFISKVIVSKDIVNRINIDYSRLLLFYAFQMFDKNMAKKAYSLLDNCKNSLRLKDWLYYFGSRNILNNLFLKFHFRLFSLIKQIFRFKITFY